MSSNKSENLNLHLWEGEDDFLRTEFNENFQKVDELAGRAYTPENLPYKAGEYTGNGEATQTIIVGFRPSFLIITRPYSSSSPSANEFLGYSVITGNAMLRERVTFTDTGFTVAVTSIQDEEPYPNLNQNHYGYCYIAFR